ncbi:MAG: metallophosphoesterase [Bacteroidota bacterium]|nr:metallophosphoesterase [Bacteroidota bacterium]
MRPRFMTFLLFVIFFVLVDLYVFQAVLTVSSDWTPWWKKIARYSFWIPTVLCIAALSWWMFSDPYKMTSAMRNWILTGLFATYFSKIFGVLFVFVDDLQRGVRWVASMFSENAPSALPGKAITRSDFLAKAAMVATAIPFGTMAYGIISGAHDYRVRRLKIKLPNLPSSFDGIRIGQISDIHAGSFFNKTAVKGGVEMMLAEKPDVIFFTGDLVNNQAFEMKEYVGVFGKLKAPLGVYSVTGNHDYGDYYNWRSQEEKRKNFHDLITVHEQLDYRLLMNEHHLLQQGGDMIAIIGNENWGGRGFTKYGRLDQAWRGTQEAAVKLLLSHDPSHWDAQVRPEFPDIDVMFSGHTHGFQFGVELGDFKWSPSQYAYKQWAGLYQKGNQYLYVNRGFGYLGYPGRIGMPPELTIVELNRG